jgi:hypothetical protein
MLVVLHREQGRGDEGLRYMRTSNGRDDILEKRGQQCSELAMG